MITDSRSFLSYTRHEYFRRILCNLLGTEIQQGLLPNDLDLIGRMVQDICYHNAAALLRLRPSQRPLSLWERVRVRANLLPCPMRGEGPG